MYKIWNYTLEVVKYLKKQVVKVFITYYNYIFKYNSVY